MRGELVLEVRDLVELSLEELTRGTRLSPLPVYSAGAVFKVAPPVGDLSLPIFSRLGLVRQSDPDGFEET